MQAIRWRSDEVESLVATCLEAMAERDDALLNVTYATASHEVTHDKLIEAMSVRDTAIARAEAAEAKVRHYELALSTTTEVDPTKTVSVASVPGNAFDVIIADRDRWKKLAIAETGRAESAVCALATLREAVEWYADVENWNLRIAQNTDLGHRARAALAEVGK